MQNGPGNSNVWFLRMLWPVSLSSLLLSVFEPDISQGVSVSKSLPSSTDVLCVRRKQVVKMNRQTGLNK